MNKTIGVIILILAIGGGGFYAGMKYGQASTPSRGGTNGQTPSGGQFRFGANNSGGQRNGGFATGEIIAKGDESLTIKLPDGGSRLIFFTPATAITKSVAGTTTDLALNENVLVNGQANSDGSLNAQTIQLGADFSRFRPNRTPNQN